MHWRNSQFQTIYFIIGKCHTADEAYRVVLQQLEDRQQAVDMAKISDEEFKIRRMKAEEQLKSNNPITRYEGEVEMKKIDVDYKYFKLNFDEAIREVDFLIECKNKLEPFRKYRDYPEHIAHQLIQQEEWKHELILRSKEFILTRGTIPEDQLRTFMLHPEFKTAILPVMDSTIKALKEGKGMDILISNELPQFKREVLALEDKQEVKQLT